MKKYITFIAIAIITMFSCSTPKRNLSPVITEKDLLISQTNMKYSDASVLGSGGNLISIDTDSSLEDFHKKVSSIPGIQINSQNGIIGINQNVLFAYNSDIINDESVGILADMATAFQNLNDTIKIEVSGHTDNIGSEDYNYALSLRRAKSVSGVLIKNGIPDTKIIIQGKGEEQPIDSNSTVQGRANNRRVELRIIK